MRISWKDKLAVVTGASSGIGEAIARRLAAHGLRVLLVARRLERLESLAAELRLKGGNVEVLALDLVRESDRVQLCERAGNADILINNAGLGWYGYADRMSWETAREMLQLNVEAVAQLSLFFLAKMRARNSGHIINIGSISGGLPSQGIAVYGATKAFMDNFTTALTREVAGTHVHVSVVRAGPVRTRFGEAARSQENGGPVPTENMGVSAEHVARRVWDLILRPRRVIYVPGIYRFVPWVEASFGWIIDLIGPALLKRQKDPRE